MASTILNVQRFSRALAAHLLLAAPLLAAPLLGGCGDSSNTSGATTTDPTGQASTGSTSGSTGPGSTGGSTEGPTSGATMGGSTGPATTEAATTEAATGSGTTGSESTGSTSEASASSGTAAETTGGPVEAACEQDSDCQLHTDCCTCDVIAKGEQPAICPIMECLIDTCSTLDVADAKPVCRFGRCTFTKISCNPVGVTCKALPPTCSPGHLPTLNDQGDCWSGQCAPIEACDWAPNCESCADKEDPLVCVFKAQKGAYHVCEPKPVGCGDQAEIDCACGQEICDASPPHTVCSDHNPGITCECPFC